MSYKLEEWGIIGNGTAYTAPECIEYSLTGRIYGRKGFEDGKRVTTSDIKTVFEDGEGWSVFTRSGSEYRLGIPSADFLKVLADRGITLEQALENLR